MNEKTRCQRRLIVTIVFLILGPIFMFGPAALGVGYLIGMNYELLAVLACSSFVLLSLVMIYRMIQNYHWIELDGPPIRGRVFWTRQLIERRIDEISEVVPLKAEFENPGSALFDEVLGRGARCCEIRFRKGGRKMGVLRLDMANADPFIQELCSRLKLKLA